MTIQDLVADVEPENDGAYIAITDLVEVNARPAHNAAGALAEAFAAFLTLEPAN